MKIFSLFLGVLILLIGSGSVGAADQDSAGEKLGSCGGQIVLADGGKPVRGFVAFFNSEGLDPMDFGQTRRTPAMITYFKEDGRFVSDPFPAGSYYIGAIMRENWRGGPPRPGEAIYSAIDDEGDYQVITIKGGQSIDLGRVTMKLPPKGMAASRVFKVSGRLLNARHEPVIGAVVTAKKEYNAAKGLYISEPSAFGGGYTIELPPGKYFLIARETVANSGRPKPDSLYGELGSDQPIGIGGKPKKEPTYISGRVGQIYKDVDIMMFDLPRPEVKRAETEARIRANKLEKDKLPDDLPLRRKQNNEGVPTRHKPEPE